VDSNYKTIPLFPSIVHRIEIDNFDDYKDQIIKDIYYEKDNDPEGRKLSNIGGWQSESVYVENCKSRFIQKIMIESLTNFKPMSNKTYMKVEGWTNVNKPGDYNKLHDHPVCELSGVLWIKTPTNCGSIRFVNPQLFSKYKELDSYTEEFKEPTYSFMTYFCRPKEGTMLIFPSHLQHEVEENKSSEDRISYSFNIQLIGDLNPQSFTDK
tara:strand:+ start:53 stop:682 length:630 start_codon:yes stop_codon:yes gene_type:complete